MSELGDYKEGSVAGQGECYWTQDICWHPELEDCSNCPEKEISSNSMEVK